MEPLVYEEIRVGDVFETDSRTITETDQLNFAGLSGAFHPLHLDKEYMEDSQFDGRLVYGFLVQDIALGLRQQAKINNENLNYAIIALYGVDDVRFINPVYIDDTITLKVEISDKYINDEESGVIDLTEHVINQDDELVMSQKTKLLIEREY